MYPQLIWYIKAKSAIVNKFVGLTQLRRKDFNRLFCKSDTHVTGNNLNANASTFAKETKSQLEAVFAAAWGNTPSLATVAA